MIPLLAWRLIGYGAIALVILGTGMRIMSLVDAGTIVKLRGYQTAQSAVVKQVKAVTAQISKGDQAAETAAQTRIVTETRTVVKKVPVYVSIKPKPAVGCITNGMLRLHDAAVLGVDPSTVLPPAGQPDDACSTTSPADFMAAVANNYGASRQNAEQLDALVNDVISRSAAVAAASKPE